MVDLLADIEARESFVPRTRTALLRAFKSLRPASSSDEQTPQFNVRSLLRIQDMNPPIYVCAILLLDARVDKEPSVIRERQEFQKLIDHLGLQSSGSAKRDVKNSHRASLVLLEVFIYMIIIDRARTAEENTRVTPGSGMYEEESLT